jgi:hypothetical protein
MNNVQRFIAFVNERQAITDKRTQGLPKPWTKDLILQNYRFCSVQREDDAVTRWIASQWRDVAKPETWFAMVVARHINAPATLTHLGYPAPWNKPHFYKVILERKEKGLRIFNPAYMINPRQLSMPTHEYLAERIFDPMWKQREEIRPREGDTLQDFYSRISAFWGMGTFMSAQVIADLKYIAPLNEATDWWTFAKSGPGSKRGMNRVLGLPAKTSMSEKIWYDHLIKLQKSLDGKVQKLHAQDLQNCLCEFDKYERSRTGEGKPKQKYQGAI